MKIKAEKSEKYKWAIVVDEKDLKRLDETIKSTLSPQNEEENIILKYKIKLSDGSKIETTDINEVVNEQNSKAHSIENIDIVANNQNSSKEINVLLGSSYFQISTISYSITGDSRDWVYLTASKIEEIIKNFKQWYSFFLKLDFGLLVFIAILIFMGFISIQPKKEIRGNISLIEYLKIIFIIITLLATIYIIYKFVKYLFPLIIFRIGDGIKRHDTIVDLRTKLFWGIFVTLFISIIAGLILITISQV